MNILITGGSGFLGARLARSLLAQGSVELLGGCSKTIEQVWLADRMPAPEDLLADARIHMVQGDLAAQIEHHQLPLSSMQVVFHLAAAVSAECEANFDLGMRSNLDTTRQLLDACRHAGNQPVVVFASSVAVFGDIPEQRLPKVVEDTTLPTPQNSYGIQKFIGEQLVADYTRKGFIRGRIVRLMTVSVRPGQPNGAASGFLSGMLREPLKGEPSRCPVPPETAVALASPSNTIKGLVRAITATPAQWGARTAVNLPALTTTVRDMAMALERIAGADVAQKIDWTVDPQVAAIITSWPSRFHAARAQALGLQADSSFDAILQDYVQENPQAVKVPVQLAQEG